MPILVHGLGLEGLDFEVQAFGGLGFWGFQAVGLKGTDVETGPYPSRGLLNLTKKR